MSPTVSGINQTAIINTRQAGDELLDNQATRGEASTRHCCMGLLHAAAAAAAQATCHRVDVRGATGTINAASGSRM